MTNHQYPLWNVPRIDVPSPRAVPEEKWLKLIREAWWCAGVANVELWIEPSITSGRNRQPARVRSNLVNGLPPKEVGNE